MSLSPRWWSGGVWRDDPGGRRIRTRDYLDLIQLKFLEPVDVFIERLLVALLEEEIADKQVIHAYSKIGAATRL